MSSNPLVSIVIPIYNIEQYLVECIDSVINQTYENIEIILVDDGAEDSCPQICDEYAQKDQRIIVIHKQNGGLSSARNNGLERAMGEYIYFLDSDDYIDVNLVNILVEKAKILKLDIVFFDSYVFGDCENFNKNYYKRKGLYSNPVSGIDMLYILIKQNEYRSSVPMNFYKVEFLKKNQLKFYEGILYEDELFTFNAYIYAKKIAHAPMQLYYRRIRENSIITSKYNQNNLTSIITVAEEMLMTYDNIPKNNRYYLKGNFNHICLSIYHIYYKLSFSQRRNIAKRLNRLKNKIKSDEVLYLDKYIGQFCDNMAINHCKAIIKRIVIKILPKRIKDYLKNSIGNIKRYRSNTNLFKILKKTKDEQRIILIGSPVHGNLGDHAIAIAQVQIFKKHFQNKTLIEISMPVYLGCRKRIKRLIKQDDLIIISGGGWLGTLWFHNEKTVRGILSDYSKNPIVILPQTVYYDSTQKDREELINAKKIYSYHKNLIVCLRDYNSYELFRNNELIKNTDNIIYMPDMALFLEADNDKTYKRDGILISLRKDLESVFNYQDISLIEQHLYSRKKTVSYTTNVYLEDIPISEREKRLADKFNEFRKAEIVITDRLHVMLFAYLTQTPCIAFDNVSRKVSGVYQWIKDCGYIKIVDSFEQFRTSFVYIINNQMGLKQIDLYSHLDNLIDKIKNMPMEK